MKYKLVIFDLDGTLADSSLGILNSISYTQELLCLPPIKQEEKLTFIGPTNRESYNKVFGLKGETLQKAVNYHKEYAMKQGYKELKLYEGIVELLDYLKQNGIVTAVATLKAQSTTLKIFEHLGITDKFDIIKGVEADNPKTKAQLLEDCIKDAKCEKSECVLIGDSKYDAIGAEQLDVDFIGVTYGFGFKSYDDLAGYKFVGVTNTVKNLRTLLGYNAL